MFCIRSRAALTLLLCLRSPAVLAHFPWLVREQNDKIAYFFGDSLADRTYHLPDTLAGVELLQSSDSGDWEALPAEPVDRKDLGGLVSTQTVSDRVVATEATYGVHRDSRLTYSTIYWGGKLPESLDCPRQRTLDHFLQVRPVDTGDGLEVYVLWKGQPLAGAIVRLLRAEGQEQDRQATDQSGKAAFSRDQLVVGKNAIIVRHSWAETGQWNGVDYASAAYYLTMTWEHQPSKAENPAGARLAPLPEAVTSFGAIRCGTALYVYGGHTGPAHTYSQEGQSDRLLKLELEDPQAAGNR